MIPVPFFSTLESDSPGGRRLLLIAYHFPPGRQVGALRWRKFARVLAAHGWGLDVVTLPPPPGVADDAPVYRDLPAGVRLFGVADAPYPGVELERRAWRLRERLRRAPVGGKGGAAAPPPRTEAFARDEVRWNLGTARGVLRLLYSLRHFVGEGRWAREAAHTALALFDPAVHRAVITSGPPHMIHQAGVAVTRATGIPFLMDLRDPWSVATIVHEYFATPLWLRLARRFEARAVGAAARVMANTEALRSEMAATFPDAAERISTVMNGFDDDPLPVGRPSDRFTIGYAGSIYFGRDPRPLFRATARVVEQLRLGPDDLEIVLAGDVASYGGVPTGEIARQEGIGHLVRLVPPMPQQEAWRFMAGCDVLVSLPWDDHLTIPAKLFEYMRFPASLLVFGRPGSAISRLLEGTAAAVVEPEQVEEIATALRSAFLERRTGRRPSPIGRDRRFSRETQAAKLLDLLEECTGARDPLVAR